MSSRQQVRAIARENPYWPERLAKLERDKEQSISKLKAAVKALDDPAPRKLGAYDVPLHLGSFTAELSERDMARLKLDHWRSMIARCNGRGFRQQPGSTKRKRSRNPRHGAVEMIMSGLFVTARYGSADVQ